MNKEQLKQKWLEEQKKAKIIEWKFVGFSVEKCFDRLLELNKIITEHKEISSKTHRYLLIAKKVI